MGKMKLDQQAHKNLEVIEQLKASLISPMMYLDGMLKQRLEKIHSAVKRIDLCFQYSIKLAIGNGKGKSEEEKQLGEERDVEKQEEKHFAEGCTPNKCGPAGQAAGEYETLADERPKHSARNFVVPQHPYPLHRRAGGDRSAEAEAVDHHQQLQPAGSSQSHFAQQAVHLHRQHQRQQTKERRAVAHFSAAESPRVGDRCEPAAA
eukprot:Colp12_sorted_trinity150504_noHs@24944